MGKRHRKQKRGGRVTPKGTRPGGSNRHGEAPAGRREPDLLDDVAEALATGNPLDLLALVSGLVDILAGPRSALAVDRGPASWPMSVTAVASIAVVVGAGSRVGDGLSVGVGMTNASSAGFS